MQDTSVIIFPDTAAFILHWVRGYGPKRTHTKYIIVLIFGTPPTCVNWRTNLIKIPSHRASSLWNPPRDVFKKWVVLPLVTSGLVQLRCATIKKVQIMAETFRLQNCSKKCWVTLLLFKDVSNAGKMRAEAVSGGVQAALLDPKLVSHQ